MKFYIELNFNQIVLFDVNCSFFHLPLNFVLRSLPPLAKKYVLQMVYIEGPVSAKSMEEWVLADGVSKHKVAIDRLIQLRLFTETADR